MGFNSAPGSIYIYIYTDIIYIQGVSLRMNRKCNERGGRKLPPTLRRMPKRPRNCGAALWWDHTEKTKPCMPRQGRKEATLAHLDSTMLPKKGICSLQEWSWKFDPFCSLIGN